MRQISIIKVNIHNHFYGCMLYHLYSYNRVTWLLSPCMIVALSSLHTSTLYFCSCPVYYSYLWRGKLNASLTQYEAYRLVHLLDTLYIACNRALAIIYYYISIEILCCTMVSTICHYYRIVSQGCFLLEVQQKWVVVMCGYYYIVATYIGILL